MINHVGMNIAAKDRVFAEVRRVLEPDGLFAVYEQMRVGDGDLTFPMPWADDEMSSFVETRERYVELLQAAGFRIERDEDRTAEVAAAGPPPPGALTPADLFGPGFAERIGNNIAATMHGILASVLIVAPRPLSIESRSRRRRGAVSPRRAPRVRDGIVEIVEQVALVREPVEHTDRLEHPEVLGSWTLEEHGDAALLELADDLAERLRAGGVEHLELRESQDDDLHVRAPR